VPFARYNLKLRPAGPHPQLVFGRAGRYAVLAGVGLVFATLPSVLYYRAVVGGPGLAAADPGDWYCFEVPILVGAAGAGRTAFVAAARVAWFLRWPAYWFLRWPADAVLWYAHWDPGARDWIRKRVGGRSVLVWAAFWRRAARACPAVRDWLHARIGGA